jgi:hypothetical protein
VVVLTGGLGRFAVFATRIAGSFLDRGIVLVERIDVVVVILELRVLVELIPLFRWNGILRPVVAVVSGRAIVAGHPTHVADRSRTWALGPSR